MSNMKKSKMHTMEEVRKKNKLTSWGSQILTLILTSNMKVTKIAQNEGFWWPSYVTSKLTSISVNLIVSIYFFVNLLHSPGVWFFDIWHLFDNLTSFWHLTYNMGTWWICAGSCVQWILPIPTRSRWGTGVMGHMGNGNGQWGPWVIGTFLPITPLILDGFLQKFNWT